MLIASSDVITSRKIFICHAQKAFKRWLGANSISPELHNAMHLKHYKWSCREQGEASVVKVSCLARERIWVGSLSPFASPSTSVISLVLSPNIFGPQQHIEPHYPIEWASLGVAPGPPRALLGGFSAKKNKTIEDTSSMKKIKLPCWLSLQWHYTLPILQLGTSGVAGGERRC